MKLSDDQISGIAMREVERRLKLFDDQQPELAKLRKQVEIMGIALKKIEERAYACRNDPSLNGAYAFDLILDTARAALKEE